MGADIPDIETIEVLHARACARKEYTYTDPHTHLSLFTAYAHKERGACCGCGCRHCPYGNGPERKTKKGGRRKGEGQEKGQKENELRRGREGGRGSSSKKAVEMESMIWPCGNVNVQV